MISIHVPAYNYNEKLKICKDYIIPELLPRYKMGPKDIVFEESLLKMIIENNNDDGVRNVKHTINDIISWINMMKYIPTDNIQIQFPYIVTCEFFEKYCKKTVKTNRDNLLSIYT